MNGVQFGTYIQAKKPRTLQILSRATLEKIGFTAAFRKQNIFYESVFG
jgi:hypothetical protein